eukprot:scaffold2298_cov21-Tisochrysis_lutea.AAC.4
MGHICVRYMHTYMQVPVFVVTGMTLRMMGGVGWPGLRTEGALWFPDLTQAGVGGLDGLG